MVSLNKPATAAIPWTTPVNDNWTSIENAILEKGVLTAKGDLIAASAASTPGNLAVGTNGQVLVADSAQTLGVKWAVWPGVSHKAVFTDGRGQLGGYSVDGTAAAGWGFLLPSGSVYSTVTKAVDSDGLHAQLNTSSTNGNAAYFQNTAAVTERDVSPILVVKFAITSTASIRFFAGLSSVIAATMLGADDPVAEYAGLQYSTNRGDTNWQFVSKDGTTQNKVDSGQAASTSIFYVRITVDESVPNVKVELLDSTFAVLASNTFTSNLPAAATDLRVVVGCTTLTTASKGVKHYGGTALNQV